MNHASVVLVWLAVFASADDNKVVTFDPTTTLTIDSSSKGCHVEMKAPVCLLTPCNGTWTVPAAGATLSVSDDQERVSVAFDGRPARALTFVTGAVTDSWWEVFAALSDVNASAATHTFEARIVDGVVEEKASKNRTIATRGAWTVDPAHAKDGYLDAGVDLMLLEKDTRSAFRLPDIENWLYYVYVDAVAQVPGLGNVTLAGLVPVRAAEST